MNDFLQSPVTIAVKRFFAEHSIRPSAKILMGVSGGIDSMVLLFILKELRHEVYASHINFTLRNTESDEDASFVAAWCERNRIRLFQKKVNTAEYGAARNLNIQSAAREIRYNWWEDLRRELDLEFIATAHHHDDNIESFLLNMLRGTGLKGLAGIPPGRGSIIRPLLQVTKNQITEFAGNFGIPFRQDSSNLKDDYLRNRIRHHVIPVLKDIAPDDDSFLQHTLMRTAYEWKSWQYLYESWTHHIILQKDGFQIKCSESEIPFLLRWLEEAGIPWSLAYDFVHQMDNTGKVLSYNGYVLSFTGDGFYLSNTPSAEKLTIHSPGLYHLKNAKFEITLCDKSELLTGGGHFIEYVDADTLQWPLTIRNVEPGDYFQPLGMQGHTKKLQDFLVDRKLEWHEKRKLRILTDQEKIIWVIGMRMDERAKITSDTRVIARISFQPLST